MRRWPTILLIVSLVANIFFVGVIGGSVWHWAHNPGPGLRGGWRKAGQMLPQPQADAFHQMIRATMQGNRETLRQGRAARADAAQLFVQPAFDANAVTAKLDQARAADMALRTQLEHNVVIFSAHLPQDQRQKMADALKQGPFREGPPHPSRGDHTD